MTAAPLIPSMKNIYMDQHLSVRLFSSNQGAAAENTGSLPPLLSFFLFFLLNLG